MVPGRLELYKDRVFPGDRKIGLQLKVKNVGGRRMDGQTRGLPLGILLSGCSFQDMSGSWAEL